ncbi:YkgJ family cysteine cluster protein [Ructibacterium gallinarum]|uniref:YkgJ family cysteine cluster protein n=1 Tax=Ructibacterium gallinarum TaxID=2779355 RepID=A0A9D5M4M3_9FIRM|nr:YkgJ family cysteine cluster protein [Ructibacterium gallinarum]MBE5040520.1 YkgJ family cysteine cluster protein [Ructibacterium gallinarum]
MDKRSKEVMKNLIENALTDEDVFEFGCVQCGECCRNRHDILLNPHDLYRIAGFLKMELQEVIEKYCETYIGDNSRLPVVRVKSKIHNEVCAFLRNGKCGIHGAKPAVCALFPLGRAVSPIGEIRYFLQKVECAAKDTKIKVHDWLEMFQLKESEEPARKWVIVCARLAVAKQKCKIDPDAEEKLNQMLYSVLYLAYDTSSDFVAQFEKNAAAAEIIFEKITGKSVEKLLKGVKLYSFSDVKYMKKQ